MTVAITAGASAPEQVVQECVDYLVERFGATVREVTFRRESVSFPLPRELRAPQGACVRAVRGNKSSQPTPAPAGRITEETDRWTTTTKTSSP